VTRRELMANVARGVKLLDEKDPLWWNGGEGASKPAIDGMVGHIDLDELDMSDTASCVLGQRHTAAYDGGLEALGIDTGSARFRFGFSLPHVVNSSEFSALTELWASVIQSRRFPRRKIARDPWIVKVNRTWVREARS